MVWVVLCISLHSSLKRLSMTTIYSSTKHFSVRALAVLAFTVAVGSTASAQSQSTKTCKNSADCDPDEACEVTSASGGSNTGCAPGQTCVTEALRDHGGIRLRREAPRMHGRFTMSVSFGVQRRPWRWRYCHRQYGSWRITASHSYPCGRRPHG